MCGERSPRRDIEHDHGRMVAKWLPAREVGTRFSSDVTQNGR